MSRERKQCVIEKCAGVGRSLGKGRYSTRCQYHRYERTENSFDGHARKKEETDTQEPKEMPQFEGTLDKLSKLSIK